MVRLGIMDVWIWPLQNRSDCMSSIASVRHLVQPDRRLISSRASSGKMTRWSSLHYPPFIHALLDDLHRGHGLFLLTAPPPPPRPPLCPCRTVTDLCLWDSVLAINHVWSAPTSVTTAASIQHSHPARPLSSPRMQMGVGGQRWFIMLFGKEGVTGQCFNGTQGGWGRWGVDA